MYVVNLIYQRPLPELEAKTAVHREYLDRFYKQGVFIASGPKIPRDGGIIIVSGKVGRAALQDILDGDPFSQHGLVRYEVTEFDPVKHDPAIAALL